MSNGHGNRGFQNETPRFGSPATHLRPRYQEIAYGPESSLLIPFQGTHLDQETDLAAAFSHLEVNQDSFNSRFVGLQDHNLLNGSMPLLRRNTNRTANGMVPRNQLRPCLTTVGDLRVNIVDLAKDQLGCRYLHSAMSSLPKEEVEIIFVEVIDRVCELMVDPFGNYVVQKLLELCSEEQRSQILLMLTKVDFLLVRICLDIIGTRAVLKLLQNLTTPQQISLVVTALSPWAVVLIKDTNGHSVIQYCVKHFSHEHTKYLLNEVADNCYGIATDKSGCCVLPHCVIYSRGAQRERLVAEIIANALLLAEDCFGNYVVQHLLGLKVLQITANLLRKFEGHYISLSCNKYGSNVVERCLLESGEQQSMRIIIELLRSPDVSMLLIDPFGNYVIQSALSVSKGFAHDALRNLIRINSPMMRSNIFGKKVLAWFEKRRQSYI